MPAATSTRVTTRHAGLAATSSGHDDERRPLVLLHGLTFDRTSWTPVLDALDAVDHGRRVIALDLPGHGASGSSACYDLEVVATAVHAAVDAAGLEHPVVVGHSISAVIASIYAALYPTAGLVTVDATLRVGPFGELVRSLEARLRGPDFTAVWAGVFESSMHAELLSPAARQLVRSTSRATQDLFLGYQRELLELPLAELEGRAHVVLAVLRAAGRPYQLIAGDGVSDDDRQWLLTQLPTAAVEVWPGSGHFPHLAHAHRFAERLAATADWSMAASHA
jgi:pimeloyl-ACP methyl ester carboxylesterase